MKFSTQLIIYGGLANFKMFPNFIAFYYEIICEIIWRGVGGVERVDEKSVAGERVKNRVYGDKLVYSLSSFVESCKKKKNFFKIDYIEIKKWILID